MDTACRRFFDPNNNVLATDSLFEILLMVDPSCLFNCFLVSREWFEVITGPIFRQTYRKLWKNHPKIFMVVGFFIHDEEITNRHHTSWDLPAVQFLPATKLGRDMNERKSMADLGNFISKSSDNGFILSGIRPDTLYISNPITRLRIQLPAPPYHKFKPCMANVLSESLNPSSFKVILVYASDHATRTLNIQTYSSSTMEWVQSAPTCFTGFSLSPRGKLDAGTLTKRGVIYWKARKNSLGCLAAYDTNSGRLRLILEPLTREVVKMRFYAGRDIPDHLVPVANFATFYGVSPQGNLRCATYSADEQDGKKAWELGRIGIWWLKKSRDWYLLHKVDLKSVWAENSALLRPLFKAAKPQRPFTFVSFVPGKADSIFVGLNTHIFVYHFHTHKLERICSSFKFSSLAFGRSYHPVTLYELGAWPRYPPSG